MLAPGAPIDFADERGTGLAAVLDALRDRDDGAYEHIRGEAVRLFPELARLQLQRTGGSAKSIAAKLVDGTEVPANALSEGLLYFLAISVLQYLTPAKVLLIEEPENGLHPARIADVMRALREVSKTTQVLIATHSPFVINELEPSEVSVVTRSHETGTSVTRIDKTPNFDERIKAHSLGELWVSYANGKDEAPLLKGGPRT